MYLGFNSFAGKVGALAAAKLCMCVAGMPLSAGAAELRTVPKHTQ